MMATQMNDFDFEEKLLLSSLHHHHLQHQQPLNLPGPNDSFSEYQNQQHRYIDDRNHHRRHHNYKQQPQPPQHHRMVSDFVNENLATTVSMSTEEDLLDNFELNFESEQPNIVDNKNTDNVNTDIIEPADTATIVSAKSTIPNRAEETFLVTPELPRNITMNTPVRNNTKPKQSRRKQQSRKNSPSRKKNQPQDATPDTIVRVEVPKTEDILCGQSRICASHPGNRTFQNVLADYAHRYDIATSKQEKMQMTKAIVSIIHDSGGRFLKYKDGMWEEISTVAARDKVSHALRTKVSSWKRQHRQLLQKEKDPFAPPTRLSLSRQSRKRSIRDASPIPLERQESSKFSDLLQSQQANFANLTTPPPTTSRHQVRHSYGGEFYQNNDGNHSHHSRRSSSSF